MRKTTTGKIFDEEARIGGFLRYWKTTLIVFLGLYALLVLGFIIMSTHTPYGSTDFHQFWYAGQFILEGRDPYQAYFSGASLPTRQPELEITPSNSPLMLLTLTMFSPLPWMAAKLIWLAVNLVLCVTCFRLTERCLPLATLDRSSRILLFLVFFDLSPTRIAIENGQTTLLVMALMLAALLFVERSCFFSGLLLGLALSKYSVSLPVALLFLFNRNYRALITAVVFQFFGFVLLAFISGNPIDVVFAEYYRLFITLMDQPGIHLAELIPGTQFDLLLPGLMTVALLAIFYFLKLSDRTYKRIASPVFNFHVLTVLTLWTLVIAYHRLYDALLVLFPVILIYQSLTVGIWGLSRGKNMMLACVIGVGLALLTIPARVVDAVLPGAYSPMTNQIPGMVILVFLLITTVLLRRSLSASLQK